jgi:hypothetical protein
MTSLLTPTRRLRGFDLRGPFGSWKGELIVQSFPCRFSIRQRPVGNKGTAAMYSSVFITNDSDVFQRTEAIEGGKDVLFVHCFRNLEDSTGKLRWN